ncbi:ribosomal protein S18-alanine N-acetyltransferase [Planococcus lenghuensis]|uniref:[Ribosomal protein bS18]-alanine N-acetyltransferase n=1 Tax=Planococcus lenghuensis TaxID=2213202 RepID=A0A1Q2KVA7_9BACL|nr:ribosomal protein S18-alanine N-acetyltransferase [Planococcus lenghuensis]AQQ52155.1 ribosomal-protein-alanine N-acetyltransferase [Planococcus lenghuensis]
MSENVIYREMTARDIGQVYAIELQSFTIPWTRDAFYHEVFYNDNALYLVAEADKRVVGYCGMWLILDEAHITNVAILPQERGKKLGEGLMRAAIQAAKEQGARHMTLEVRVSNETAQNLYRKLGFIEGGVRKRYYTDNYEDALVMWVTFND